MATARKVVKPARGSRVKTSKKAKRGTAKVSKSSKRQRKVKPKRGRPRLPENQKRASPVARVRRLSRESHHSRGSSPSRHVILDASKHKKSKPKKTGSKRFGATPNRKERLRPFLQTDWPAAPSTTSESSRSSSSVSSRASFSTPAGSRSPSPVASRSHSPARVAIAHPPISELLRRAKTKKCWNKRSKRNPRHCTAVTHATLNVSLFARLLFRSFTPTLSSLVFHH
eukprot:GHVT01023278.1.p1 GENE.GHVT01023278.1~~GHVT01023278.1.p1  ORF type:complete len:227 (-),score=27.60 GHVT01023278.1:1036-1716(-)